VSQAGRERAAAVLSSGWIGYGPECRTLEQTFTRHRGGFALATVNCTAALHLAGRRLAAMGGPGGEIVVPSMSFVASGMSFAEAGLVPIVAGVRGDDLTLDAAAAEAAITPRTRAILVVHLYGQRAGDIDALRALADRRGLALVEDCAHRVDLLDAAPPIGDYACYSFNAVKELPAGEGGLLWCRDADAAPFLLATSNLGLGIDTLGRAATLRHGDYAFEATRGLKFRLSDLSAAVVNGAIPSLAATRAMRRALIERYARLLEPLAPAVRPLARRDDDSWLMAVVRVDAGARDAIRTSMAAEGVATSVHYPSLARHPVFARDLPSAGCDDADLEIVTLPTWLGLDAHDQRRVVSALASALDAPASAAGAAAP
jgi:UDP-4-amino-4-deoxy-L-arabinose-oxoglutarate aminotransferase